MYLERLCEELAKEFTELTPDEIRQLFLTHPGSQVEAEQFAKFMLSGDVEPVMTFLA